MPEWRLFTSLSYFTVSLLPRTSPLGNDRQRTAAWWKDLRADFSGQFHEMEGVKVRKYVHPFQFRLEPGTGVLSHFLVVGHPTKSIMVGMKSKERGRKYLKVGLDWLGISPVVVQVSLNLWVAEQ